jgi:ABC-2 type transport system ATP-binding protein
VLPLDEPTASLDPDVADKVRRILKGMRAERGLTLLYTSHNMREVEELCDRVLFVHRGRILAEGTPRELSERFEGAGMEDVFLRLARGGDLYVAEDVPR